jgi:hypothetical protein
MSHRPRRILRFVPADLYRRCTLHDCETCRQDAPDGRCQVLVNGEIIQIIQCVRHNGLWSAESNDRSRFRLATCPDLRLEMETQDTAEC